MINPICSSQIFSKVARDIATLI